MSVETKPELYLHAFGWNRDGVLESIKAGEFDLEFWFPGRPIDLEELAKQVRAELPFIPFGCDHRDSVTGECLGHQEQAH